MSCAVPVKAKTSCTEASNEPRQYPKPHPRVGDKPSTWICKCYGVRQDLIEPCRTSCPCAGCGSLIWQSLVVRGVRELPADQIWRRWRDYRPFAWRMSSLTSTVSLDRRSCASPVPISLALFSIARACAFLCIRRRMTA